MPFAQYSGQDGKPENWMMRKNGIDKLEFLVVLAATALVIGVAVGTNPAYSDEGRAAEVEVQAASAEETASSEITPAASQRNAPATAPQAHDDAAVDQEGYEWSGSRPAGQRYLWSHRPN
jgi:hypothetical protein